MCRACSTLPWSRAAHCAAGSLPCVRPLRRAGAAAAPANCHTLCAPCAQHTPADDEGAPAPPAPAAFASLRAPCRWARRAGTPSSSSASRARTSTAREGRAGAPIAVAAGCAPALREEERTPGARENPASSHHLDDLTRRALLAIQPLLRARSVACVPWELGGEDLLLLSEGREEEHLCEAQVGWQGEQRCRWRGNDAPAPGFLPLQAWAAGLGRQVATFSRPRHLLGPQRVSPFTRSSGWPPCRCTPPGEQRHPRRRLRDSPYLFVALAPRPRACAGTRSPRRLAHDSPLPARCCCRVARRTMGKVSGGLESRQRGQRAQRRSQRGNSGAARAA